MRRGACALLNSRTGWKVVAEAANGHEAVEKAIALKPDVAILDVSMPDLDGVQVAHQILEALPRTRILVLTMHESEQLVRRVLDAGALGYVLKSDLSESLVKAVRAVCVGRRFLSPKISEIVLDGFLKTRTQPQPMESASSHTTPRENEITRLLAEAKSNKQIAALLGITVRTVETHRANIMIKLGVHSLAELIRYAIRNQLATP